MTDVVQPNTVHHVPKMTVKYIPRSLKENWTTSVFREELAMLDSLITGHRRVVNYVLETETQREFKNPQLKSTPYLKHIEQNRFGRYAYTPKQNAPRGTIPTFNGKAYPEVIPRFHLPKMPF